MSRSMGTSSNTLEAGPLSNKCLLKLFSFVDDVTTAIPAYDGRHLISIFRMAGGRHSAAIYTPFFFPHLREGMDRILYTAIVVTSHGLMFLCQGRRA